MRALPLAMEHEALGASFGAVGDWRAPLDYGDPAKEQRAVRASVGVIDLSSKGKIRVTGPDRMTFLDGLLTNDMKTLESGRGFWAATLDHKGRVHRDMIVYNVGDAFLLATEPEAGASVLAYLNTLLVSDDVTMTDATDEFAVLGIHGPESRGVAAKLAGLPPPTAPYEIVKGGRFRMIRNPPFGGGGYEFWTPIGQDLSLW